MSTLAPIADRLAKLVRMLTSDRDGEVVAAARSINRTLKSAGLDIHALAAAIEGNGAGRTAPHEPAWHSVACECAARPERLWSDKERAFVADMVRWTQLGGVPSEKQAKWLRSIYVRVRR
jgi:hypothetical protein